MEDSVPRSTPSFAELTFLIDLARISKAGRLIGFLNPCIYRNIVKETTCAALAEAGANCCVKSLTGNAGHERDIAQRRTPSLRLQLR